MKYFDQDDRGYSNIFWSNGDLNMERMDSTLIRKPVDGSTVIEGTLASVDVNLLDPDTISVTAITEDGTTNVTDGGIALSTWKEINITFNNPMGGQFWLKMEIEPFGKDLPFNTEGIFEKIEGEDAYLAEIPPKQGPYTITLPLKENNKGGRVKLQVRYSLEKPDDGA